MKKLLFWLSVIAIVCGGFIFLTGVPYQIRQSGRSACETTATTNSTTVSDCLAPYESNAEMFEIIALAALVLGAVGAIALWRPVYGKSQNIGDLKI